MDPVSDRGSAPDRTLPLNLLLKGRSCLVVGGGAVACRKVRTLLARGAHVIVVAPKMHGDLRTLAAGDRLDLREAAYDGALLPEVKPLLVYAATDDDALNQEVARDAKAARILATCASSWRAGDFLSPSIIPWGGGQISVTTEGASCLQSQFMRKRLEGLFGTERTWLFVGGSRPRDAEVGSRSTDGLEQLAALEEYALVSSDDGAGLYAWAADDDDLVATVVRVLGWDEAFGHVAVGRGDEVVEQALRGGGTRLLGALERAGEAGSAGPRLAQLAVVLREASSDV